MKIIEGYIFKVLALFVLISAVLSFKAERESVALKDDLIHLSSVQYGLFNLDVWEENLAEIISTEIREFQIDDSNRPELESRISRILNTAIDFLEEDFNRKSNQSFFGFIQGSVAYVTGLFDHIRKNVPELTSGIIDGLNDTENKERIKIFLIERLNEYRNETFSETDYTQRDEILLKHTKSSTRDAQIYLSNRIEDINRKNKLNKTALMFLALLVILFNLFNTGIKSRLDFFLLIGICLIFLSLGLSLPMIEIDARLSELSFTLLDHPILFENQVLYYRSKSIIQVISLMIFQPEFKLILIGIMVLLFSVCFPIVKLVYSGIHVLGRQQMKSSFSHFIIFKSGKWSMADVFLVSIFMAFIGFDKIVSDQINQLEDLSSELHVLTTNNSSLLFGFYVFAAFVILSITMSQRIKNNTAKS